MGKGVTGLDRTQLSCLVEMVLGDTGISLAPRILGPLAAVRAGGRQSRFRWGFG